MSLKVSAQPKGSSWEGSGFGKRFKGGLCSGSYTLQQIVEVLWSSVALSTTCYSWFFLKLIFFLNRTCFCRKFLSTDNSHPSPPKKKKKINRNHLQSHYPKITIVNYSLSYVALRVRKLEENTLSWKALCKYEVFLLSEKFLNLNLFTAKNPFISSHF